MTKMVEETCETCEFNFWGMCAGNDDLYGQFLTRKQFSEGCECWSIGFNAWMELEESQGR